MAAKPKPNNNDNRVPALAPRKPAKPSKEEKQS